MLREEEHLDCRELRSDTDSGFSMVLGESPQKIGVVGCETSNGLKISLTVSAFSFPQFTQIHSSIFLTFTKKPLQRFKLMPNNTGTIRALTWMEDRACKFNVSEMARTFCHSLSTCLTFKIPIGGSHTRVVETSNFELVRSFINNFWMFNFRN